MAGRIFIISAPSGAGKTSLARALVRRVPGAALSVSHTTRARRPGETEGVDYHFVDGTTFREMVKSGHFLEHAEVFGNLYGTSRGAVEKLREQGCDVILDIDWQGARRTRELIPDAVSIFILPPSLAELERRLRARGQDSEDVIRARMREAVDQMAHHGEYQHLVVNDDFQAALADLEAIVSGRPERAREPVVNPAELVREGSRAC